MTPYFINTDLELRSDDNLADLLAGFGDELFVLHSELVDGHHFATFELSHDQSLEPVENFRAWCDVFDSLEGNAKTLWENCTSRVLDIGLASGNEFPPFQFRLPHELAKRAASLGVEIAVTVYPIEED